MTTRRTIGMFSLAVSLAGCSFIDDFGHFTTQQGSDAGSDAGSNDAGRADGGIDGGDASSCEPVDADGDGYYAIACNGDDCDDTNALRHPGAVEVCSSGVADADCNPTTPTCAGSGDPCSSDADCDVGLTCSSGACAAAATCSTNAECMAIGFSRCSAEGECLTMAGTEGRQCRSDGTCDAGLECRNNTCFRPCVADSDCSGAEFPHCANEDADGSFECWPVTGCDFVNDTGCPAGQVCRVVASTATSMLGGCLVPDAWLGLGSVCLSYNTCEAGTECLMVDPSMTMGQCTAFCYTDETTCSSCAPLTQSDGAPLLYMGRGLGVCVG